MPTASHTYKLLFKEIEIGAVQQTDADFPNLWGDFLPATPVEHSQIHAHIQNYIEYSREADRLAQQLGFDIFDERELTFVDLIECSDWWLVESTGLRHPILVPMFGGDGITWRWDPSRTSSPAR